MNTYDVLRDKRDGKELTKEQIEFFVKGVTDGSIADYQTAAFLMAVCINGMTERETVDLTLAMADSGEKTDLSAIRGVKVDKHSTGGVGDKISLIAVPIAAACGVKVAKMSGRGLGHTGGTIDKLESINGFKTDLSREQFIQTVNDVGASIIGQSGDIDPADKKMYALRDVTATVESIPLIVSSIMSKKIAAGADAIVLDVKVGSGSFSKNKDFAIKLATEMVKIGKGAGRKVVALLTNMDVPLGNAVGNLLEVAEAAKTLKGLGAKDLTEEAVEIAANMMFLADSGSIDECRKKAAESLKNGLAYKKFKQMIAAQGGDASVLEKTDDIFAAVPQEKIFAAADGYVGKTDAEKIGKSAMLLGAGRAKKEDGIDYLAGIVLSKKTGDKVKKGDLIATLFSTDKSKFAAAKNEFLSSFAVTPDKPAVQNSVIDRIV